MTLIKDVTNAIEDWAPLHLQANYDNAGLIVGDFKAEVTGVVVCLDSIEEVIDEAISVGANLVVAHHPIVFSGLKQINGSNYIEKTIIKAIKNDIAIYAAHTNLDSVPTGVNLKICELLGLTETQILKAHDKEGLEGAGMIGCVNSVEETIFLKKIKKVFNAGVLRHTKLLNKPVLRVAVCGGSGSFLLADAIKQKADVFLTADFKYHQFFDAENKILIADIGHNEIEFFTTELICDYLTQKFTTFVPHFSKVNTNPVYYL